MIGNCISSCKWIRSTPGDIRRQVQPACFAWDPESPPCDAENLLGSTNGKGT